jgi:hypothetical protein
MYRIDSSDRHRRFGIRLATPPLFRRLGCVFYAVMYAYWCCAGTLNIKKNLPGQRDLLQAAAAASRQVLV